VASVDLTAFLLGTSLFLLGLLHLYWCLGGSWRRETATPTVDGRPTARPSTASFAAVAAGLWAAAFLAFSRIAPFGRWDVHGATAPWLWGCAALFAFRAIGDFRLIGFFCRRADAACRDRERRLVAALCLFLALGFFRLAILPPGPA